MTINQFIEEYSMSTEITEGYTRIGENDDLEQTKLFCCIDGGLEICFITENELFEYIATA